MNKHPLFTQGSARINLSVTPHTEERFNGRSFDHILSESLDTLDPDISASRSFHEINDLDSISRDYDFAHEKSQAIDNSFDNMMFIIDEINDPNDKKIEHPMFGTIEDWSTMGGLMQLNVAMQLMNTMYNTAEGLPELGLKIERKLSSGMSG